MKKVILYMGIVAGMLATLSACKKDDNSPPGNDGETGYVTTPYNLEAPPNFPPIKIPADNPMTVEGVALGRMLYYDPILDKDSARSCATCHVQSKAFQNGSNILPHMNFAWQKNYLWNGAVSGSLEKVMHFETEEFFQTDLARINRNQQYRTLFKNAFGVDSITYKDIAYALAQFERIMISSNSKFDKWLRGEVNLTELEREGYVLFNTEEADCFHCHATILFTDNQMRNNALDENPDAGYFEVTGDPKDIGRFKTPSLRNIEYRAPYMHDGRFATLEEVIDFYSEGLKESPTVDPLMVYLHQGGVHLTTHEKEALLAFLKTLSDPDYLTNPELSNPFTP